MKIHIGTIATDALRKGMPMAKPIKHYLIYFSTILATLFFC